VQLIDARGQKVIYTYEDWGPTKLEQQYPTTAATVPTRTVTYTRDNRGNVLTVMDDGIQSGQSYASTYDALDRRYDETFSYIPGGNRVLQHRYDRFGNRKQMGLQDAAPVTNTYDFNKLNRLATASLAGASLTNTYYADDDRQTLAYPNGVTETYTYKTNGPLDTVSSAGPSGPLTAFSYTYDDALNVATLTDGDGVHSFLYDGANRVTQAVHPSASGLGTEGFAYDRAGNRKDPANPSLWTYDTNNRIVQGGAATYTFDADGSVATKSDGSTFSHDVESRLAGYAGGSITASYLYDSVGHRIRKTVNGTTTWFLWDGTSLLAEYDASGNRTMRYGYLPGAFVAVQVQDANGTYYVHSDAMQAPRVLTNSAGQPVWQARYATYGAAVVNGNGVGIIYNQRLPGQYFDPESALSYNYMRYYDAALGRYAESDPIGLSGGINLYAYVSGNPISNVDPLGLLCFNFNQFADDIEQNRFDLGAVLGTLGTTLGIGTMSKVPSELRGFGVPKSELNPYTSQLSRWSSRLNIPGARAVGRTAVGVAAGAAATAATIFEGFYDLSVEAQAAINATSSGDCGCQK
jgi:RHS repeat-associated protein